MSPFGSIPQLTPTDLEVVLLYLKNEVKELYDMLGYVEEFINRVMAMIQNHANVPGFKTWAAGILSQLREEKEKKAQKEKEAQIEEAVMKGRLMESEKFNKEFIVSCGNVPNDEPLAKFINRGFVLNVIKEAEQCVGPSDVFNRILVPLFNKRIITTLDMLNKQLLEAIILHSEPLQKTCNVESLYNGIRHLKGYKELVMS